MSDHLPIFSFIGTQMPTHEKVLNINNELNNIDWDIIDHLDIDDACNVMVSQIQIALNAQAPEKTTHIPYKKILRQDLDDHCITKIISNQKYTIQNCIAYRNIYNRLKRISKQNYYDSELV